MKRTAPAAERNVAPIISALSPRLSKLPSSALLLEIASGPGLHAARLAQTFERLIVQPTDISDSALTSIEAWRAELNAPNLRPAVRLDVLRPWPLEKADAMLNINMIHIAPWACCEALLEGAQRLLPAQGPLMIYGPFRFNGSFHAPSNAAFDASLRARDPAWGVRDIEDVERAARARSLKLVEQLALPANNHIMVFERSG